MALEFTLRVVYDINITLVRKALQSEHKIINVIRFFKSALLLVSVQNHVLYAYVFTISKGNEEIVDTCVDTFVDTCADMCVDTFVDLMSRITCARVSTRVP